VCAAAGLDVLAQSNLREQCFAKKDPAAQEACRSYVEESRFKVSDIISLGRELEKQLLYANAVAVYKQGLRYYPEHRELLQQLQWAESFLKEATLPNTTSHTGTRDDLAKIKCKRLQGAQALEACQRAIALDPDNATLHEPLGDVLTGLGRGADANKAYQEARRLGRENAGKTGSDQPKTPPSKPPAEPAPSDSVAGKAPLPSPSIDSQTLSAQLQLLDKLKKEGAISEEEYKERRTRLLDAAFTPQPLPTPEQPARTDDDRIVLADIKLGDFYALVIGNND
jgi:tetratricopeptide (TPR) repeat protein